MEKTRQNPQIRWKRVIGHRIGIKFRGFFGIFREIYCDFVCADFLLYCVILYTA